MSQVAASAVVVREIGSAPWRGQSLEMCEVGPPGAPVVGLYLHGTGSSRLEVGAYAASAERLGVRVIAWDRPGHGRTPRRHPGSIVDVVGQGRAVLDFVGARHPIADRPRPVAIGLSGGGSHALVLAALGGDLIRSAIAINPGPPSDDSTLTVLDRTPAGARIARMIRLARTRPRTFRALAGAMQAHNPMSEALNRRSLDPLDRQIVTDPALRPLLEEAAIEGRRQRHAWVDEAAMLWGADWPVTLKSFTVPLQVYVGQRDPFRPFGESLRASGAAIRHLPGGHLGGFAPATVTEIIERASEGR